MDNHPFVPGKPPTPETYPVAPSGDGTSHALLDDQENLLPEQVAKTPDEEHAGDPQRKGDVQGPSQLPQSPEQKQVAQFLPIQVTFYLYIQSFQADEAFITFQTESKSLKLEPFKTVNGNIIWTRTVIFHQDPFILSYRYHVTVTGSWLSFSGKPRKEIDVEQRPIESAVHYDTFHSQDDEHYHDVTLPQSCFTYVKWLLENVNDKNIKEILMQLEKMKFTFSSSLLKHAVGWILSQARERSVTDVQCLYLCIILGQLSISNGRKFSFPTEKKVAKSSDCLLRSLSALARSNVLPSSSLEKLEKIAPVLVNGSSNPCWLSLAAHFYPYFGVKYVVELPVNEHTCDAKEFWRLVWLLLSAITIDKETSQLHRELLDHLLVSAPDREALLLLYEKSDLDRFFSSPADKDDAFVQILGRTLRPSSRRIANYGEHLVQLSKIPAQLLSKMSQLVYNSLQLFLESTDTPDTVQIDAFYHLIKLQSNALLPEKIESVLDELAHSPSWRLQDLLVQIMNSDAFSSSWRGVPFEKKVDICSAWIMAKVKRIQRNATPSEKASAAYAAAEELTRCYLNVKNKVLAIKICEKVAVKVLRSVDDTAIIEAYKTIENYSEIVQECYRNHVRNMLRENPRLVTKAISEVDGLSSYRPSYKFRKSSDLSSLGQDLLLCVLDVVEVSGENAKREDIFREMLELADVWIVLLNAEGCVEKLQSSPNFKIGKNHWQVLAFNIMEGSQSISLEFLKDVQRHKEKLSFICALVNAEPSPADSDLSKAKKEYLTRINAIVEAHEQIGKTFAILDSAINYSKKISEDVHPVDGIGEVISEFNQLRKKWQTQEQFEEWNDNAWGDLLPLLKPAKTLFPLVNSVSFANMAENCLQEIQCSSVCDDDEGIHDLFGLMHFLTSRVVERFSNQWNPVFSNLGALTLETLKTLLGSLDSAEELEEEFKFLERHFRREFVAGVKHYIKSYVMYPNVLKQVKHLLALLDVFEVNDPLTDVTLGSLVSFVESLENHAELSLESLYSLVFNVRKIVADFTGDEIEGVIEELGRSNELITFLKEILDEDIRFLIDAVEEHSDQFVSESSVSDLIDVHGFLSPLIKTHQSSCTVKKFLVTLKQLLGDYKNVGIKIQQCSANVNSLRGLYTSVANRGEITKVIVANSLKNGVYLVSLTEDCACEAKMSYEGKEQKTVSYSLPDLHDLRSRAHLIVNSDKKASPAAEKNVDIDFSSFIQQVNLVTEITVLLSKLRSSGYAKYRKFWKILKGTESLQCTKNNLQQELNEWERILSNARKQYYFLNYYRSDQLCILHEFLTCSTHVNCKEVLPLIHFVDPKIKKEQLKNCREFYHARNQEKPTEDPYEMISRVGDALDDLFTGTTPAIRSIKNKDDNKGPTPSFVSQLNATVKPRELFVASLEEESPLTTNVILTLYENTTNAFPEPHQIVFCSSQTTWEEIHLFLQRCFFQSEWLKYDSLFCIANVEQLTNEIQFKVVNAIKEVQKNYELEPSEKRKMYRLALICRGGDHHHIVERFSQYAHRIAGMTDSALSARLKSAWPEVTVITSSLPGLGKTETVKKEVLKKRKNIVTFSVSGPLDPTKLVQRLKSINLKAYHCLHLDIGEVNDPVWLDTFLFQLIVIGMVSSETQFYHLETQHVYIEVANTLKNWLQNSLVICKNFTRTHLKWQEYDNLLVSSEITSKIQVVCHYFDAFDKARLESNDILFRGPNKVKPLPADRCRELLAKYYSSDTDITFTALNTFLAVLADQLVKFSRSSFFTIANLASMLGNKTDHIRSNLFLALYEVSKEFASRSIITCRLSHPSDTVQPKESAKALNKAMAVNAMTANGMVERMKGLIKWEDSNHLLVVFQGISSQTIAAVYRNRTLVPENVKRLLTSQIVRGGSKTLEDFKVLSQKQLQEKLERIACSKPMKIEGACPADSNYALTPDNILKMILIILRIRAHVPVIIMGETGCGKTSLVRYLANTCEIPFHVFNFHAGVTEEEVAEFIIEQEDQVKDGVEQIWVFLDEINTCDHLGVINNIMCHHTLFGRPLSDNLIFLAACNPYKLRPEDHIKTAGLEGKNVTDEHSRLVYRVHPLPEGMIDYVWDYGALGPKDEKAYIQRMVRGLPKKFEGLLVDLLSESQRFIREAEKNHYCVSLRDVHRCILLITWFLEMDKKRKKLNSGQKTPTHKHLLVHHYMSDRYNSMPMVKSIVLALAHCYQSRLPTADLRRKYRQCMMELFCHKGTTMNTESKTDSFSAIVRMEEEDYLDRMELPPFTARNAALRENVFVMLVCILNRIPVFVVGKPGCSKSLSIQLIRSNLRGRDSKDALFKELPQLYVVSYQGSESSTSEGIIKVFDKALKYSNHNTDGNVLPVVLLDEVGLAENSKYNPLKVLHSLLEPGDGQLPDVAVVGISNWSLDAAKMNRAIHLSRPDPDVDDLYETGQSLHYDDCRTSKQSMGSKELKFLAEAYFEYQSKQRYANFHGLRDYYSLIKSLSLKRGIDLEQINKALQRNFGGIHGELANIRKIFLDKLKECITFNLSSEDEIVPVTKLIQENLDDPLARHLMLITNGDSAIGILKQTLSQLGKEIIVIFGSRFEEDLSEEYNYRTLSRIILCMERNCILILRDLESIYGSLYDMLNQNYAVVGKRKNCRIALGAFSNPICHVDDGFRCIVLTDREKVNFSDPPFLNRFEKQLLRFSDVLNHRQRSLIEVLRRWVQRISAVQGHESHFNETDMFIGYHEDTLPSLVLLHSQNKEDAENDQDIVRKSKDDLMWIATPDAVLRAKISHCMKDDSSEVNMLSDAYFRKPIQSGFADFIKASIHEESPYFRGDEVGAKTIVMTFSNIHTDILRCLGDSVKCQVERLGAYKSEKQLTEKVNNFWMASEADLLVLQCKPEIDANHLLLARSIIEERRSAYKQDSQEKGFQRKKHVCMVVHVQRETTDTSVPWQFSFLCGWHQVFLDVLDAPPVPLNEILSVSVPKLLTSTILPFKEIAQDVLLWCFTCINYRRQQRSLQSILHIVRELLRSRRVYSAIEQLVVQSVKTRQDNEADLNEHWQVKVACDRQVLVNCSTLYAAMEYYVSRLVRLPLAKIIYFLEKENAWPPHIVAQGVPEDGYEELWCKFILREDILKLGEIPEPLGGESYSLDSINLELHLPFSQLLIERVNGVKDLFLEDRALLMKNETNLNEFDQLKADIKFQQIKRYSTIISKQAPEIEEFPANSFTSYMDDLFDILSADFNTKLTRKQRVSIVKAAYMSRVKDLPQTEEALFSYAQLHAFVWINKEQVLDLLRMIVSCLPFVEAEFSESLTNQFLSSYSHISSHESIDLAEGDENYPYFSEDDNNASQEADLRDKAVEDNNNPMPAKDGTESPLKEDEADEIFGNFVESHVEQGCFEDILVTAYCEKMLPSEDVVLKQNCSLISWMRNSSLLLSLASRISDQTTAFHFLRLCVDLARIGTDFSTHDLAKETWHPLHILNEIGSSLKPEYLDADTSFGEIYDKLISQLQSKMKLKFSAMFYGRCIDTNADAYSVPAIVEHVLSVDQDGEVLLMGPVILRLFMVEESESPGVLTKVIAEPELIQDHPCLDAIDQGLKNLSTKGKTNNDSYTAVMICDLIQSFLNFDGRLNIHELSSDCDVLNCARKATDILSQASDADNNNCGLRLLSAVAFLRWFFTLFARSVEEKASVLKDDSVYSHLMADVNSILTVAVRNDARRSSLQLFFLKQLRQHMSLFELRKMCSDSKKLPAIKTLWAEEDQCTTKTEFVSPIKLKQYRQVEDAFRKLSKDNKTEDMLLVIKHCHSSSNHRLALLGILINMFYLQRAVRKLTDQEERLACWFGEKIEQFQSPLKALLLRILGLQDFKTPHLQISPESSVEEVEIALLILHISSIVASGAQKDADRSPFYEYFTNPAHCQDSLILADGEQVKQRISGIGEFTDSSLHFATCICGLRFVTKADTQDYRCPNCGETFHPDSKSVKNANDGIEESVADNCSPNANQKSSTKQWDSRIDYMNSAEHQALHLIAYALMYAGHSVAVQLTSTEDLFSLLMAKGSLICSMKDDDRPNPAQLLYELLINDLAQLEAILGCSKEHTITVMHFVIENCASLIRGSAAPVESLKEIDRKDWVKAFANRAKSLLVKALAPATQLKRVMQAPVDQEKRSNSLKNQIEELDDYPTELLVQNYQLKRLFRITRKPTFEDFRAKFVNSSNDFQAQHKFLSMFFAKFDELPLLGNLYHLLKWARLVSSSLCYRISRKESQLNSVDDFIHGSFLNLNRQQEEIESLKKHFSNFENAWNNMRPLVNQKLRQKEKEMPRLTEESEIAYCLIETDSGFYLRTAFEILSSLQNKILDEMMYLSLTCHHPALQFLEKNFNLSGVPCISLQEAKESDIINFHWSSEASKGHNPTYDEDVHNNQNVPQWSNEVFKYAHNNPEYGKGDEIKYDFEQIEMILAHGLAFGKCHLTIYFNKFVFSKEFFHSCGPLLSEIRELVPQRPTLPDNVRHGLANLKECRIKEAQSLLQQIEVLIFLLKRVKCDPEMTLETFAVNWLSMLPNPFPVSLLPQPSSSIKLQHITALYEALEDMLADGAIKAVPEQFRNELSGHMKDHMRDLVSKKENKMLLQAFINALRRFVFRYLSSEKFLPEPSTPLSTCLNEPSLWSPCIKPPDLEVITKELTLTYLHSLIAHLQTLEEEKKGNGHHASQPGRMAARPQVVKIGRRRAVKF